MNKLLGIDKSGIQETKKAVYSLSLILLLAMTLMMAFAQTGFAQIGVPQPEKTAGYISVAPTLVGVDQSATVNLWIMPLPTDYLYGTYDNGFSGITVTFTGPAEQQTRSNQSTEQDYMLQEKQRQQAHCTSLMRRMLLVTGV